MGQVEGDAHAGNLNQTRNKTNSFGTTNLLVIRCDSTRFELAARRPVGCDRAGDRRIIPPALENDLEAILLQRDPTPQVRAPEIHAGRRRPVAFSRACF